MLKLHTQGLSNINRSKKRCEWTKILQCPNLRKMCRKNVSGTSMPTLTRMRSARRKGMYRLSSSPMAQVRLTITYIHKRFMKAGWGEQSTTSKSRQRSNHRLAVRTPTHIVTRYRNKSSLPKSSSPSHSFPIPLQLIRRHLNTPNRSTGRSTIRCRRSTIS